MLQQTGPKHSCLAIAFATACDVDVNKFIEKIGVKNELIWPEYKEPLCYRSWHLQECILAAYKFGFATTVFEKTIYLGHEIGKLIEIEMDLTNLTSSRMVLISDSHAVASDGTFIYNSNGLKYANYKFDYQIKCLIFDLIK
jgi:hypothetical protein